MTLVVILVVLLGALIGVAGLRLAQMRAVPMAGVREAPATTAGDPNLEMSSDAWTHSQSQAVSDVLSRYFNAINSKNYSAWTDTVTSARAAQDPQEKWTTGYRSTKVGTIRLTRIDDAGSGRLIALVSFASTQNAQDSPDKRPQNCWRVSYTLTGDPLRIDATGPSGVLVGPCR
ncbi:hypothetical protein [Pseudonocardia spinosispora]|uniref:hypothetical protein n=1 Tax=Pseudonocardia spinosispora TaxID=103441 RepID=UPI0003FED21C|nr:hypothetical protein [Pseudonocardia spinosispora]